MDDEKVELEGGWELDSDHVLKGDSMNVTLYVKRESTAKSKIPGKVYWCPEGYFPTASMALKRYCNDRLNEACSSEEDIIDEIDSLYDLIDNIGDRLNAVVKPITNGGDIDE